MIGRSEYIPATHLRYLAISQDPRPIRTTRQLEAPEQTTAEGAGVLTGDHALGRRCAFSLPG
jgi:hypothetical protein